MYALVEVLSRFRKIHSESNNRKLNDSRKRTRNSKLK